MQTDTSNHYERARRAYELGRLRWSASRALLVTGVVALFAAITMGPASLWPLPVTLAAWVFAYWRGDVLLRGALYGLLGGVATQLLPMSILRPCCKLERMAEGDCCTMPGACLLAGASVGVLLAAVVPFGRASWWRTAFGMCCGLMSIAVLRCATLFTGEALGLAGGLVGGLLLASIARSRLAMAR